MTQPYPSATIAVKKRLRFFRNIHERLRAARTVAAGAALGIALGLCVRGNCRAVAPPCIGRTRFAATYNLSAWISEHLYENYSERNRARVKQVSRARRNVEELNGPSGLRQFVDLDRCLPSLHLDRCELFVLSSSFW
jgi:hypothetical protein